MATETDARAGRAHPEAELVAAAGGSDGARVKLCITNVYNSSSSEVVSLETTNTVGDLKALIEAAFAGRPPPHQQRLIFRGKQCEEGQQLGHVLRGADLAVQHNMHLVVTQPTERTATPDSAFRAARHPPPQQQQQPPPPPSVNSGAAPSVPAVVTGQPERIDLSAEQMGQLQWQYQQALRENQEALQQHQQNHNFLSSQSVALTQQQQQQQQQDQQPRRYHMEVATSAATRALGGNMPGPAAGGAVRDVTGPPPAHFIPAAGLGEGPEAGIGNLVDPPQRAQDAGREARGLMKMVLQCMVVFMVFGIDADGLMLVLLAVGGLVTVLFKTGFLKEMLGGRQVGGGMWKKLCSAATVIAEGGGFLMDARFLMTSFVLSLFPKWRPVRSPEAIAAEAAAQAAAEAARVAEAAAAEAARVAEAAAAEVAAAEAARAAEVAAAEAAQAAALERARREALPSVSELEVD